MSEFTEIYTPHNREMVLEGCCDCAEGRINGALFAVLYVSGPFPCRQECVSLCVIWPLGRINRSVSLFLYAP